MGACRENRPSENTLNSVILSVRSLDKLLWHGQKWAVQDIEEYVGCIKRDLDELVKQFKKEVGHEDPPTDFQCGCCNRPPIEDLLRPIGDLLQSNEKK